MKYRCPIHIFMKPLKTIYVVHGLYINIYIHIVVDNEWLSLSREGKKQNSRLEELL